MSRCMIALLWPSPPTALQVLTADIASGIVKTNNLDLLAACCKSLLWALHVADGGWVSLLWLVRWRSRFLFQWHQWHGSPSNQWWWPRTFWTLPAQASRRVEEAYRCHSTAGMEWRLFKQCSSWAVTCGDWPNWPVSDRNGRQKWILQPPETPEWPP